MSTIFKIGFFSLFITTTLTPFFAFPGAVSAGGLLSPVRLECLFVNPQSPLEPLNFTVAQLISNEATARLDQFNLQISESIWSVSYDHFFIYSKDDLRFYFAGINDTEMAVQINTSQLAPNSQAKTLFAPLFEVKNTTLVDGARKYESELKFKGLTYQGLCADEFFIFYGSAF